MSTIPGLFQSLVKYGELFVSQRLQGTKHGFMEASFGFLTPDKKKD